MKIATVALKSASPYSQSRHYASSPGCEKREKETSSEYDARLWREHQHYDAQTGIIYIPCMALKMAIQEAAQYLGERVPGKGKATWTKHFLAGIGIYESPTLGIHKDNTECETFMCDSMGKKGGSSRVPRTFPVVRNWSAQATFYVLDDAITEKAFTYHLEQAGKFIGIGRFRPRNGGFYGRFSVESVTWS
jgi:hypothetical protein